MVARWEDHNHFMQVGVVDFVPRYGLLAPHAFAILRVIVHADCNPLIINNSFELRLKEIPLTKVCLSEGGEHRLSSCLWRP